MSIYEQILNEDNTDAEAYWSLVLCRYGIEYVEDPATHSHVPTVNRAQFTSVFDDDNYLSALEYADENQRGIYEKEAKAINEIQKGILAISQKEEPFDVFICYKETDNNGRRTPDSVLANDLYHQLVQEGFKVFFARICLEDKLGSAYEPYIFAALNSAKVMVVLGTKPEYFNAVWVKNEWSRYLTLIKQGQKKMLIPAYKDMDPYDLPMEFSHLQAQDMSKLGFMQDLIRGINKIVQAEAPRPSSVNGSTFTFGSINTAPLLKRAFMFLEDGDWNSADEYCERVLDMDPENASAYLCKLLAELKLKTQESLKGLPEPFDGYNNYQKAIRFADENLKSTLVGYINYINVRNENVRLDGIYNDAKNAMTNARSESEYKNAAHLFETISNYLDSTTLAQTCYEKAEITRKDGILYRGKKNMKGVLISSYIQAIELFKSIPGWRDADEQIDICKRRIEEIVKKEKEDARIAKRKGIIITSIICTVIAFLILLICLIIPNNKYNAAITFMDAGKYNIAIAYFERINNYKDSADQIIECKYLLAAKLMDAGRYGEAVAAFDEIENYRDSADQLNECMRMTLKNSEVGDYVFWSSYEQDNDTSNGEEAIEWLVIDRVDNKILVISKYALNCQPYNTENTSVTWETCSLRKWLNDTFFNAAFSPEEQAMISTVTVSADANPKYDTDPGNATEDQVFLLSIQEAYRYFDFSKVCCKATAYAVASGASVANNATCCWWLRSPGNKQNKAIFFNSNGIVDYEGDYNNIIKYYAIRPALWIDLDKLIP